MLYITKKKKDKGLHSRINGSTTNCGPAGHIDRGRANPSLLFISRLCLHRLSYSCEASMPILSNMNCD